MPIKETVNNFVSNPFAFMKENYVVVWGSAEAGVKIFQMGPMEGKLIKGPGTILGAWRKHERPCWQVNGTGKGVINLDDVQLEDDELIAYNVPMKQIGDNIANVVGTPPCDGSVSLMLTAQLSGCAFAFSNKSSQFIAMHLQPKSGASKEQKQSEIAEKILEGLGSDHKVVARDQHYKDYATIVGQFKDGRWRVYCQKHDVVGMDKEITGITEI